MKGNFLLFSVLAALLFLTGATVPEGNTVIFKQGAKELPLKNVDTLQINKESFSFIFWNKKYNSKKNLFHSAQIAVFTTKQLFDNIKPGMNVDDIPCYSPGTGMATADLYQELIFNEDAHHYTFYEDSKSRRLDLISKSGDWLKLEFPVKKFLIEGRSLPIEQSELSTFYISILIDRNLDKKIDSTELTKITIQFTK